jgi:hypothetical protein
VGVFLVGGGWGGGGPAPPPPPHAEEDEEEEEWHLFAGRIETACEKSLVYAGEIVEQSISNLILGWKGADDDEGEDESKPSD